jgi:hypothetical protein
MNQKPYGNSQFIRTSKKDSKLVKIYQTAETNCELNKQTGISPAFSSLHNCITILLLQP